MKDIFELINESRFESGQGSETGRNKSQTGGKVSAEKARVRIFPTIMDALRKGKVGQMFSTKDADRLYVISKQKWGDDPDQVVGGRIAKGFTPGSAKPGASFKDVKGFAVRTMARHGNREKKFKGKRFFKSGFRGKN